MKTRKSDLKSMPKEELDKNLAELRKELMKLSSQVKTGTPPENPGRMRTVKRMIARILTFRGSQSKGKEVGLKA